MSVCPAISTLLVSLFFPWFFFLMLLVRSSLLQDPLWNLLRSLLCSL